MGKTAHGLNHTTSSLAMSVNANGTDSLVFIDYMTDEKVMNAEVYEVYRALLSASKYRWTMA